MELRWPETETADPVGTLIKTKEFADPSFASLDATLEESDNWAREILSKAGLPVEIGKLQSKLDSLEEGTSEWYAGNSLLQSFTLRSALENGDQATTILLGFLLADFRWQGHFAETREQQLADKKLVEEILSDSNEEDLEVESYRAAINALQKKYPHCSVNALRLLLCNKLNVSKQRLDELDIRPDSA